MMLWCTIKKKKWCCQLKYNKSSYVNVGLHLYSKIVKKQIGKFWTWWNIVIVKVIIISYILWQRLIKFFFLNYISWSSLQLVMVMWQFLISRSSDTLHLGISSSTSPVQTSMVLPTSAIGCGHSGKFGSHV